MIELFEFLSLKVYVNNVIYLALVLVFIVAAKRIVNRRLEGYLKRNGWRQGREKSLVKITNQIGVLLGFLLCFKAVTAHNPGFSFSDFLNYNLIDPVTEKVNGQVIEKFHLRIGSILFIIFLFILARVLVGVFKIIIQRISNKRVWIDEARRYTIIQLTKYLVYTIILTTSLSSLGINMTLLLHASTTFFVAIGLGLREAFTDIVSGFILLFDGSVRVGDIIELGPEIAKVKKISIRTSQVKTMDGKIIVVPNAKLTEESVVNWSISEKVTRFKIEVSVAYGTNTELVKELLYDCALKHPLVDKKRNIVIMFSNFGDNGLQFELYFWAARTWEIMVIKSDLRFAIDKAFRDNNIKIPFPQRDLHIISDNRPKSFS